FERNAAMKVCQNFDGSHSLRLRKSLVKQRRDETLFSQSPRQGNPLSSGPTRQGLVGRKHFFQFRAFRLFECGATAKLNPIDTSAGTATTDGDIEFSFPPHGQRHGSKPHTVAWFEKDLHYSVMGGSRGFQLDRINPPQAPA